MLGRCSWWAGFSFRIFTPSSGTYLEGGGSFYTKWLGDLALDQKPSGSVPHVIPNVLDRKNPSASTGSAGWADAAVIVPWDVYLSYGDTRILEQQYPSMKRWVDYMAVRAGDTLLWNRDFTYGDWLAFATNRRDPSSDRRTS